MDDLLVVGLGSAIFSSRQQRPLVRRKKTDRQGFEVATWKVRMDSVCYAIGNRHSNLSSLFPSSQPWCLSLAPANSKGYLEYSNREGQDPKFHS